MYVGWKAVVWVPRLQRGWEKYNIKDLGTQKEIGIKKIFEMYVWWEAVGWSQDSKEDLKN